MFNAYILFMMQILAASVVTMMAVGGVVIAIAVIYEIYKVLFTKDNKKLG